MRTVVLLLVAGSIAFAQNPSYRVTREGHSYTRIESSFLHIPPGMRLRVMAPGKVVTRGESRIDIAYVLKRRVRASSAEQAQKLLAGRPVQLLIRGEWAYLMVPPSAPGVPAPELEIRVPRGLRQTAFHVDDGAVSATDLDGPVSVEARSGGVVLDRILSNVIAQTGGGEIRLGKISGSIKCRSGGGSIFVDTAGQDANLQTAGGEVFVRYASGPLEVSASGGGNVQVIQAGSSVTASTNGGLVEVQKAYGTVYADTSGGSIVIGSARGVRCQSRAGAIQLHSVSGSLRAYTLVGSITADLAPAPMQDSFLNTSSGDITVSIPSTLAVTVQAESDNAGRMGSILSDFYEIRIRNTWTLGRPFLAEGTLNGGGPLLKVAAAGGAVHLKRQK